MCAWRRLAESPSGRISMCSLNAGRWFPHSGQRYVAGFRFCAGRTAHQCGVLVSLMRHIRSPSSKASSPAGRDKGEPEGGRTGLPPADSQLGRRPDTGLAANTLKRPRILALMYTRSGSRPATTLCLIGSSRVSGYRRRQRRAELTDRCFPVCCPTREAIFSLEKRKALFKGLSLMGREGFEPSTLGLRVPCSTN